MPAPAKKVRTGQNYTEALGMDATGVRIGVVLEDFGAPGAELQLDARVLEAGNRLAQVGAEVRKISIPLHATGAAICTPIFLEGATDLMMHANAYGTNLKCVFLESLQGSPRRLARSR